MVMMWNSIASRTASACCSRYHLKLWIGVLDESAAYLPA